MSLASHKQRTWEKATARLLARLWIHALKHPPILGGVMYAWLTAVGFAHLFGTGIGIGVNLVDLAATSDFLLSGLRNPIVTLLAIASGCGMFYAIGRAVTRRSSGILVFAGAVTLLVTCAVLAAGYRRSVTSGFLSHHWGAPCPMVVRLEGDETWTGRFGAATADFIVVVEDRHRSTVLPRSKTSEMKVDCSSRRVGPSQ